jgi:hypothetical protein
VIFLVASFRHVAKKKFSSNILLQIPFFENFFYQETLKFEISPKITTLNQQQHREKHRPRLELGGNNGDNNNGNKTGAIHGPLIDEGISLVAFGGFRYWVVGCWLEFFFFFSMYSVIDGCA